MRLFRRHPHCRRIRMGYKQLMRVEQCWRQPNSGLRIRPSFTAALAHSGAHYDHRDHLAHGAHRGDTYQKTWRNLARPARSDQRRGVRPQRRSRSPDSLPRSPFAAPLARLGVSAVPRLHDVATPASQHGPDNEILSIILKLQRNVSKVGFRRQKSAARADGFCRNRTRPVKSTQARFDQDRSSVEASCAVTRLARRRRPHRMRTAAAALPGEP